MSKRLLSLVAAACVLGVAATSLSSAAPIYTDWSTPVNLGPVVNSAVDRARPGALPGRAEPLLLLRPTGWVRRQRHLGLAAATVNDAWGAPVNLGPTINTTATKFVPSFSTDGHWMFFASDRPRRVRRRRPLPVLPRGHPRRFRLADADQPRRRTSTPRQTRTETATSTTEAPRSCSSAAIGSGAVGDADLYVSNRQADGSWGPATRIPELSSTATENRPNIRHDGLEIFFYSDRAGGSWRHRSLDRDTSHASTHPGRRRSTSARP